MSTPKLPYNQRQSLGSWEQQVLNSDRRDWRDGLSKFLGLDAASIIAGREVNPVTKQVDVNLGDWIMGNSRAELNLAKEAETQAKLNNLASPLMALDPTFKVDQNTSLSGVKLGLENAKDKRAINQATDLARAKFDLPGAVHARGIQQDSIDASDLLAQRTYNLALGDRADRRTDAAANRVHEIELQEASQNAARNQWLEQIAYLDRKDEQKKLEAEQMLKFMALQGGLEAIAELLV